MEKEYIFKVKHHDVFNAWYKSLQKSHDQMLYNRVVKRLERVKKGNFGDHKPVGGDISELRFKFGAGLRIYYTRRGRDIILLLCAGDKSSQQSDIELAKQLSGEV